MSKFKQREWVVTFTVYADPDYTESDIVEQIEQALDNEKPLSGDLDCVLITAQAR